MEQPKLQWSEYVVLVDATFLDSLVLDFVMNFSAMIGRQLGKLDLCHWLDCLLLDSGITEGEHNTFVAFLHPLGAKRMSAVNPGDFKEELDGKAFSDNLGEFTLASFPIEKVTTRGEFLADALKAAMESESTKKILVVGDMQEYADLLCETASGESKSEVTFFTMANLPAGKFKHQILGYSVMSGLGIRGEELR